MSIFTRMPAARVKQIAADIFASEEPAIKIGLDNARAAAENVGRVHAPMAHKTAVDNMAAAIYWHNQLAKGEAYSPLDFTAISEQLGALLWPEPAGEIEQGRYMVLSTRHLDPETSKRMEEDVSDTFPVSAFHPTIWEGKYGFWVSAYHPQGGTLLSEQEREDFPDLANCIDYAAERGFQYILFDSDGPVLDTLMVHEW